MEIIECQKAVIMNFDQAFVNEPGKYKFDNFPKYLYDKNYFNDVNYLLNKEIDIKYSQHAVSKNKHKEYTDLDTVFVWDKDKSVKYGKSVVIKSLNDTEKHSPLNRDYYTQNIQTLCKYISDNPQVEFYFFLSPYSIAFWYNQIKYDIFNDWKDFLYYSFSELLKYDNCKIYLMTDDYSLDYICDLENYRDTQHYKTTMNKYIADCIGTEKNLLSKDNYKQRLEEFFNFIENIDYDYIFKG